MRDFYGTYREEPCNKEEVASNRNLWHTKKGIRVDGKKCFWNNWLDIVKYIS